MSNAKPLVSHPTHNAEPSHDLTRSRMFFSKNCLILSTSSGHCGVIVVTTKRPKIFYSTSPCLTACSNALFARKALHLYQKKIEGGEKLSEECEEMHTYTLFYLAQVLRHLGQAKRVTAFSRTPCTSLEFEQSAEYCHRTLVRQYKSGKFNPNEWCDNSVHLSGHLCAFEICSERILRILCV